MKVKAKIVLKCCSMHSEEIKLCAYTTEREDSFDDCNEYIKYGDICAKLGTKTIYIDKEYKEVEVIKQKAEDIIVLKLGNKKYINDNMTNLEIEYLYIDDKAIVKDYLIVPEEEEAE